MCESTGDLLVKIWGNGPNDTRYWQAGDIIHAFSPWRIQLTHAWHICCPRYPDGSRPMDTYGLREDPCGLTRLFLEKSSRYRFERVSHYEVLRTNLLTGEHILVSTFCRHSHPDGHNGVSYANIPLWIEKRRQHALRTGRGRPLFGKPGREVWFDQELGTITSERLNDIWDAIEVETPLRRADHDRWPMGSMDAKLNLLIPVTGLTQAVANQIEDSRHGVRRLWRIPYWEILTDTEKAHAYNADMPFRVERTLDLQTILQAKPPHEFHTSAMTLLEESTYVSRQSQQHIVGVAA